LVVFVWFGQKRFATEPREDGKFLFLTILFHEHTVRADTPQQFQSAKLIAFL